MSRPNEYHWTIGYFDHIEFPGGGDPVPAAPTQMSTGEGHACISDAGGTLVMYTDGTRLWDGSLGTSSQIATALGGHLSSSQSAIIVPPAGPGGTDYHVFATGSDDDWVFSGSTDPVIHSTYRPQSGTVSQIIAPAPISVPGAPNYDNTERMAAVSHVDCDTYWVILQNGKTNQLHALLVDSDAAPSTVVTSTSALQSSGSWEGGYMKVSPDGTIVAFADFADGYVALLRFDRTSGVLSDMHRIEKTEGCYGIEFSPDSKTLYIAATGTSEVRAHTISNGAQTFAALTLVLAGTPVLAMQLGPNNKIYGRIAGAGTLMEIGQPNTPANPAASASATYADGSVITLSQQNTNGGAGLPSFTRIADNCAVEHDICADIAGGVNDALSDLAAHMENRLKPCEEGAAGPEPDTCTPLDLPDIAPRIAIKWGDSPCDGMESDDVEVMTLTICNPYSNVTLSGLTVHQMTVTLPDGAPVPALPDGTASVTVVPRGPQCFGDIAPCSCTSREFTVHTRGAKAGDYTITLSGICFDLCMHHDTDACFVLPVCED